MISYTYTVRREGGQYHYGAKKIYEVEIDYSDGNKEVLQHISQEDASTLLKSRNKAIQQEIFNKYRR